MPQFVFIGPQGRLAIPEGECRMGSDSSCPVCVRGEGVLPTHAYLKVQGEAVLIRPAAEGVPLLVDGRPASGPEQVRRGQRVGLGPVELRLEVVGAGRRFPWRWLAYPCGVLAALVLVLVVLRYFWFNEAWWRQQILATVEGALGREGAELDAVELDLLGGRLRLKGLRVPNREPFPQDAPLLRVEELEARVDAWPLARSGFSELRASGLKFVRPELIIRRVERDGRPVSNVDDLPGRLARQTSQWVRGLTALEAEVEVTEGLLRFRDEYTGVGESRLENVGLSVRQPGFGQKLKFELSAEPVADGRPRGKVDLQGELRLFDAAGRVEREEIGDGSMEVDLASFDLARLCSHLQWELSVRGGRQRVAPGKPVSGQFHVKLPDLKSCEIRGKAESESLVSVLEPGQPPIGSIPTVLDLSDLSYDFENGRPSKLEIALRSAQSLEDARRAAQPKVLVLRATGKRTPGGDERFVVDLSTLLQDLCATDVGERLNLKGRLEGRLSARAELIRDTARGETRVEAWAKLSDDARVLVPHPTEAGSAKWQPTRLEVRLDATAHPNAQGQLSEIRANFKATSDSFEAESTTPARIESLDEWDRLRVYTQFKMNLRGRDFWAEFGPVLGLFGFEQPIEEVLSLNVTVYSGAEGTAADGGSRHISLAFKGQSARQWKPDPKPINVDAIVDYFPEVFAAWKAGAPEGPGAARPYLRLALQTGGPQEHPYVRLEQVELTREGPRTTIRVPRFWIESDMAVLRERFAPYLDRLSQFLKADPLRDYSLKGYIGQSGSLSLAVETRRGAPAQPLDLEFDFSVVGKELVLSGPVRSAAAGQARQPKRWEWSESGPQMAVKGRYQYRPAPTREEPEVSRFDELALDMRGRLGSFKLTAAGLDLYLLEKLAAQTRTPGKSWPDVVGRLQVTGTIEPAAFDFLRGLQWPSLQPWLEDPLVGGTLKLNLDYDGREDRVNLRQLTFHQAEVANPFWLKELDAVARLRGMRGMARSLTGQAAAGTVNAAFLLDHLSDALVVRTLVFDAAGFSHWLARHPPPAEGGPARAPSVADLVPEGLAVLLRSRRLEPRGLWSVTDLGLWPLGNQERSWGLMGQFRSDFSCVFPPEVRLPPRRPGKPATLEVAGPWSLPQKSAASFALSPDGRNVSFLVRADLQDAEVGLAGVLPEWSYAKAGGQPLRLELEGACASGRGGEDDLLEAKSLTLKGGPLELEVADLQARIGPAQPDAPGPLELLSVGAAAVRGGPVFRNCELEKFRYRRAENRLGLTLRASQVDLGAAAALAGRLPGGSLEGRLSEAALEFDGAPQALLKLDFDQQRDRFSLDAHLQEVAFTGEVPPAERAMLQLTGSLTLAPGRIQGRNLDLALLHHAPPSGAPAGRSSEHRWVMGELLIAAGDPTQTLRRALQAEPLSLQLNLPMVFKTPLDVEALRAAAEALRRAWQGGPAPPPAEERANPYEALSALRADGALSTPLLRYGDLTLERFDVPRYSLRELKLNVPLYGFRCCGGDLIVSQARYDLSHPSVHHTQHVELTKAGLKSLLRLADTDYQTLGAFSLEGDLAGLGLKPNRSWNGGVDIQLQDLALVAPQPGAGPAAPPSEVAWMDRLPLLVRRGLHNLGGQSSATVAELVKGLPALSGPRQGFNGSLLALQVFLSAYGYGANRLEFEPARIQVTVSNGVAQVRPIRLIGRGPTMGLELGGAGSVRVWDGSLDDRLEFWPLRLPDAARSVLKLDAWPAALRQQFVEEMSKGKLPLSVTGSLEAPRCEFPFAAIREHVRRAMPPPPPPPPPTPPPGGRRPGRDTRTQPPPPPPPPEKKLSPVGALYDEFQRLAGEEARP